MNRKQLGCCAASIIISALIVSYVSDARPALAEIGLLHASLKTLTQELLVSERLHQQAMHDNASVKENALMSIKEDQPALAAALVGLLQKNGLAVQAMDMASVNKLASADVGLIHLTLKGDFNQLSTFIAALPVQPYPLLVTDFSFKSDTSGDLLLSMDIMQAMVMRMASTTIAASPTVATHTPFCFSPTATAPPPEDNATNLQAAALNQMKMVGYMNQGERSAALILLPNNALTEISPGAVLGKERALVNVVMQDRVVLTLPDNQRYELRL